MNRTYFHIGRSSSHLPPYITSTQDTEISSKNSLEEVSEDMGFPYSRSFLFTVHQGKARTLWAVVLFVIDEELGCTLLSKSWENFRSFFKPCWNFGPFSDRFGLCNGNFYMNRYNTKTCPTNLIMATMNTSMQ